MTARQSRFRLTLASNPKLIGRVETFLNKVNTTLHLDEIQFHKLMVSLTEAVNNAILHGNRANIRKKVTVQCDVVPGWLIVTVMDEGKGFDPGRVRNPLKKKNLLLENGRGIFLMRTLMDRVEFEPGRNGTAVRLWLNLNK